MVFGGVFEYVQMNQQSAVLIVNIPKNEKGLENHCIQRPPEYSNSMVDCYFVDLYSKIDLGQQ